LKAIDPAAILLQEDDRPQAVAESIRPIEELAAFPQPQPATPRKKSTTINLSQLPPLTTNDPPLWRRHLHWLLALALIPLVVSLLTKAEEASLLERLRETLDQATPVERDRIIHGLEHAKSLDDILQALPDQRLPGALLSRSSLAHLMMAAVAILFYMAFFMFLAADGSAKPLHVLAVGLFTATIGVAFLLLVQLLASFTEGRVLVGFNIVALIFLVLKFVAFSYGAAMNPENGFFLSLVGFTLGLKQAKISLLLYKF
jgi:hypothetical protein